MSTNEPPLNFAQTPSVISKLGDAEVLHSASVVIPKGIPLTLDIANLRYLLVLESNGGEHNITTRDQNDRGFTIVLTNFDNPLGTSLRPIQVGTVQNKPLWLTCFVQAPAGDKGPHVMSYSVYWGGQFD